LNANPAGLLTHGSSYSPRLPEGFSGIVRFSSPITVAGQRGILTLFPIIACGKQAHLIGIFILFFRWFYQTTP
jgi:hypothetical protein